MKIKQLSFTLLLLYLSFFGMAQQKNHPAVTYNNVIVNEHQLLMALVTDYLMYTVQSNDAQGIEQKRIQVIKQVDIAIEKIKSLTPFEEDTHMRDEALAVLMMYKEAYTQDFTTINTLKAESQKSYEAMRQYLKAEELAENKLNRTLLRFQKAQLAFAEKYELTISMENDELPMDIIFQVYKYNREVFLLYFKVFMQNDACLKALYTYDGKKLEQERLKLLQDTEEVITALESMEAYQQDNDYKESALAYVEFHQTFAQEGMVKLVAFFNQKERSKAETDQANALLDTYNVALEEVNDAFHEANIRLFQKYIPQEVQHKTE